MRRSSQRFSPSRLSRLLIPLILALLSVLLVATLTAIVISLFGVLT